MQGSPISDDEWHTVPRRKWEETKDSRKLIVRYLPSDPKQNTARSLIDGFVDVIMGFLIGCFLVRFSVPAIFRLAMDNR